MEREGSLTVSLQYEWRAVESAPGQPYRFPEPLGDDARERYEGPAVYRWVVEGALGGSSRTHVGEADDLVRAIGSYRNPPPGQQSAARLKREMTEAVLMGGEVRLETLHVVSLTVDGQAYGAQALRQPAVRQLLKGVLGLRAAKRP